MTMRHEMPPSKRTAAHRGKGLCAPLRLVFLAPSVIVFASLPVRATGLIIVPTFDDASFIAAGYNPTDVHTAFEMAEQPFENTFSDPVHVNIMVQAGNTALGSSSTNLLGFLDYAATRSTLLGDYAANPDSIRATAGTSLGTTDPTNGGSFVFAKAEAKALGLVLDDSTLDGTFTFSKSQQYTWDNTAASGKFDFVGVAEHEISEIMGRISILGTNFGTGKSYDPDDLFRYRAGTRSLNQTDTGVYFSINGGTTNLMGFNSNSTGDLSDYNGSSPTDPFNAFTGPDQADVFSTVDRTNMEVVGWDPNPTPEPTSLLLLASGSLMLVGMGMRRKLQLPKIRVDEN